MEPPSTTQPKIVLASRSPRRVDLLTKLLDEAFGEGEMPFDIEPADIDETPLEFETPLAHVQRLAQGKAHVVAQRYTDLDVIVIAADTTVDVDGEIYGKPENLDDARRMLSGDPHQAVQLIHIANRGDAVRVLRCPAPVDKAGRTVVAGSRVDFR